MGSSTQTHTFNLWAVVFATLLLAATAQNKGELSDNWLMIFKKGVNLTPLWEWCDRLVTTGKCHEVFEKVLTGVADAVSKSIWTPHELNVIPTNAIKSGEFSHEDLASMMDMFKGQLDAVERDSEIRVSTVDDVDHFDLIERRRLLDVQSEPEWGLDMIDQTTLPLDNIYEFSDTGVGVNVYVLDTGIRTTHKEFQRADGTSRAVPAYSAIENEDPEDCHGHGTHVAAVVGGNTFGVAKNVTLHAIKVLGCSGSASYFSLLKGMEWLAVNHVPPAIAVMSINGKRKDAINLAVENLIKNYHVHVVVASGNANFEACGTSPASATTALTVGAVDSERRRYHKSNWGPCVDIHAPGVKIRSAGAFNDTSELYKTGTSMACPFVAGVVARYLEHNPGAAALELSQKLIESSAKGKIKDDANGMGTFTPHLRPGLLDISSTPNRLLYANLEIQAYIQPGMITLSRDLEPVELSIRLATRPSHLVLVHAQVPDGWDEKPKGSVQPNVLQFNYGDYDIEQKMTFVPRNISEGHFFMFLWFRSEAENFHDAVQSVRILDHRPLDGDSVYGPRVIQELPFIDVGDTTPFANTVTYTPGEDSVDVTYAFTPPKDVDVDISTCGSMFDTTLMVFTDVSNLSSFVFNDDSPTCISDSENSAISTTMKAGVMYYITIDGYKAAAGHYTLSVTPSTKPRGSATEAMGS